MQKSILLITTVLSAFFFSCQKEADLLAAGTTETTATNNIDLSGTWKFMGTHAKTSSTNEMVIGGDALKTIMTSDYITANNTGTVTFTSGIMNSDNFSYSVNTLGFATVYENGVITDTFSVPIQASIPAMNAKTAFRRVGTDSLYFEGGSSMMGGASQATSPSGAKLRREQDKLYLTQKVFEIKNTTEQGQTVKQTQQAEVVTTLQKQ